MPDLVSFLAVASLIAVTPGADMALVARNTLAHGRRGGATTSVGILSGILVHGIAATLGLSAVIAASSVTYNVIKVAGAVYLVALGAQTLWRIRSRTTSHDPPPNTTHRRPFTEGLMTNILNPKISVLFLSLMPQFVNNRSSATQQIVILTLTFLLVGVVWLTFYVVLIHQVRELFDRAAVRRRIDWVVGCVLITFGLRLLLRPV